MILLVVLIPSLALRALIVGFVVFLVGVVFVFLVLVLLGFLILLFLLVVPGFFVALQAQGYSTSSRSGTAINVPVPA